jgi:hypothetical protein
VQTRAFYAINLKSCSYNQFCTPFPEASCFIYHLNTNLSNMADVVTQTGVDMWASRIRREDFSNTYLKQYYWATMSSASNYNVQGGKCPSVVLHMADKTCAKKTEMLTDRFQRAVSAIRCQRNMVEGQQRWYKREEKRCTTLPHLASKGKVTVKLWRLN